MKFSVKDKKRFWSKVGSPNDKGCLLWKTGTNSKGYGRFHLNRKGHGAHRIAFYLEYGRLPYKNLLLAHLCEDYYPPEDMTYRRCVNIEHLKETSYSENTKMSYNNKRQKPVHFIGEDNPMAKLNPTKVKAIKKDLSNKVNQYLLAEKYNVDQATISHINTGKLWKHISRD